MSEDDLPVLDIPHPCLIPWSSMGGEGTARTCDRCQRAVHDFSALSGAQIQALMSDPSKRLCARMDWKTIQHLGAGPLRALILSTMLTAVGVVSAAKSSESPTSDLITIRGTVHAGDQPIPDVEVRARHEGVGKATVTKTDKHGAYSFGNLTPGLYVVSFTAETSRRRSSDVAVEVCKGTTVVLDSSAIDYSHVLGEVVVWSDRPGVISGRVTSQNVDDGLSGAAVHLTQSENGLQRTTRTNTGGYYSFAGLKPGRYELTGAAKGFKRRSIDFDLKAKQPQMSSGPGPRLIDPVDLRGDIALCPRDAE